MGVGEPPGGPRGRGARPGGRPHPREQGVGPLAFIFGDNFSLFILRYSCWKYALEAIIKGLLLYFLVHDNCLLFML